MRHFFKKSNITYIVVFYFKYYIYIYVFYNFLINNLNLYFSTGKSYFSPCHAGCSHILGHNKVTSRSTLVIHIYSGNHILLSHHSLCHSLSIQTSPFRTPHYPTVIKLIIIYSIAYLLLSLIISLSLRIFHSYHFQSLPNYLIPTISIFEFIYQPSISSSPFHTLYHSPYSSPHSLSLSPPLPPSSILTASA